MVFFLFLLRFVITQLDAIFMTIFGWSVTALFGRLPGKKQEVVSFAVILSIVWPVLMAGLVVPSFAEWMLSFAHVERWAGLRVVRVTWGALAVLSPLVVGGLTAWAAPTKGRGLLGNLLHGYPLAFGFFMAFLITATTAPLIKLASIVSGKEDRHVYVQPHAGRYQAVLRELAEACARAGLVPEITDVPLVRSLATRVLTLFAPETVRSFVRERVQCVRADGLELFLYPSDLLLRGLPERIALVRAMMTRTTIEHDAYLVRSQRGQRLQDQLTRLLVVVMRHERYRFELGATAARRLAAIWGDMNEADVSPLPYDDWVVLAAMARGLERRMVGDKVGTDVFPLDDEHDELGTVARIVNATSTMSAWRLPRRV